MTPLDEFAKSLQRPDVHDWIRQGLIGDGVEIDGPFGARTLIYADYVASGRALMQVEDFIRDRVLPYYANSHTQASYCGAFTTGLREAARGEIARMTGAGPDTSVIFAGAGSTAGINRIAGLLDIDALTRQGGRAVVLIGPYEHHSNILPWRESGAEVIEVDEASCGGPDLERLEAFLMSARDADLIVGSFSAASNVTGILTDTDAVTRLLKRHGALAIWDYGCGGPYIEMDMRAGTDASKDAIVLSPHKFPGGPGASGLAIVRDTLARRERPTLPGGGTVTYVSPWGHRYSNCLSKREEGGTPNVLGDIRAALAMLVKEALGQDWLSARQTELRERAFRVWSCNPRIELLGGDLATAALPIFSFRVRDADGTLIHHQVFTRLLSDVHGIQARGGCACAGPYGHRLLGLGREESDAAFAAIDRGEGTENPGWVRLNLSALMSDAKIDAIIDKVNSLAFEAPVYMDCYRAAEVANTFPVSLDQKRNALAR